MITPINTSPPPPHKNGETPPRLLDAVEETDSETDASVGDWVSVRAGGVDVGVGDASGGGDVGVAVTVGDIVSGAPENNPGVGIATRVAVGKGVADAATGALPAVGRTLG